MTLSRDRSTFITDLLVLCLLTGGAFELASHIIGIKSRVAAAAFALVWLRGAVTAISGLRRNRARAWRFDVQREGAVIALALAGAAPWLAVQLFHEMPGIWQIWQSEGLPPWIRLSVAFMAIVAAWRSSALVRGSGPERRLLDSAEPASYLLSAWLLIVSTSALVGLLTAGQIVAFSICRLRAQEEPLGGDVMTTFDSLVGGSPILSPVSSNAAFADLI